MSGASDIEAFAARVEALGRMNAAVAVEAEQPVADVVRRTAARGTTPTGEKWPEKKEGGQALEGAAAAVQSSVKGNTIKITIGQPFVFHNYGGSSGKFHAPRRQILPDAGTVPDGMREAIKKSAAKIFAKAMGR